LYPFARYAEASGAGGLMPKIAVLHSGKVQKFLLRDMAVAELELLDPTTVETS